MRSYIRKNWDIPDEQPSGRNLPDGFFSPDVEVFNNFNLLISDVEYRMMLSALMLGAKIAYPENWGALVDIWLSLTLDNVQYVGDGAYYPPYADFIAWHPVSPYRSDLDQKPFPQMVFPAWNVYNFELPEIVADFAAWFGFDLETFTGYRTGDALSFVINANMGDISDAVDVWLFGGDPDNILKTGFDIHVNGSGTLAIEFLTVPLGGRVIWEIDEEPNLQDLVLGIFQDDDDILETDKDITSLPPETDTESIEEITITGEGNHIVYVRLLPVLNDQIIPIAWGAGVRSIRLGNGLEPVNPETGEIITDGSISDSSQNLGLVTMTYQEMLDALDAHERRRASRYLLAADIENIESEISVSKTGDVLATSITSLPASYDGSVYERLSGSALYQATQFKAIFDEINAKKTALWLTDNIVKMVAFTVNLPILDLFDMTSYLAADPQISINAAELAEAIYCYGNFKSGVFGYASQAHTEVEFAYIVDMASQIPLATINDWIAEGKLQPDDAYLDYACYRVEPETLVIPAIANITGIYDYVVGTSLNRFLNKRVRIQLSGFWSNSDGQVYDGMYLVASAGTLTPKVYQRLGTISPVPVYNAGHTYATIQVMPVSIGSSAIRFDTGMNGTPSTGTISMTITDIGEALL